MTNTTRTKRIYWLAALILSLLLLTVACILAACTSAPAQNGEPEVSAGPTTEEPPASQSPVPSANADSIIIVAAVGDVMGDGTLRTINLVTSEVLTYPGSNDTASYRDISMQIIGGGIEKTIQITAGIVDYTIPELIVDDVTGDGIPDILINLPIMGSTRPSACSYIYTGIDGALFELLDMELFQSQLVHTVTYKDQYQMDIDSVYGGQTITLEFSDVYARHPEWFYVWDGNTDTALLYDSTGLLNPNRKSWEPEESVLSGVSVYSDEVTHRRGICIEQDIWGGARSGDFVGTMTSFWQWDDIDDQFVFVEQTFSPWYTDLEPYSDVLNQYRSLLWMENNEKSYILENAGNYVNRNLAWDIDDQSLICYAFCDINSDGISELIIGARLSDEIFIQYDIFTFANDTVVSVFANAFENSCIDNSKGFGFNCFFSLQENGIIVINAHVGSGFWIDEFYQIDTSGKAVLIEGVYSSFPGDDSVIRRHYITDEDVYSTDNPVISDDVYTTMLELYLRDTDDVMAPPIGQRDNGLQLEWNQLRTHD